MISNKQIFICDNCQHKVISETLEDCDNMECAICLECCQGYYIWQKPGTDKPETYKFVCNKCGDVVISHYDRDDKYFNHTACFTYCGGYYIWQQPEPNSQPGLRFETVLAKM